jgi:hypothetical protein
MLAGDGGLFGLRPHPFGASVAALHCSASLTLSASNLVEILILHLEFFPRKKKNPPKWVFHVGWGWRIIRPAASPLRGQRRYAPLFGFAHAQRVEPGGDSHPPSGVFPRKKEKPPKWAFPCWLGMEDYSACGLTPSGPASLRSTVRLRSRSARRTWWRFSSSIWSFSPKKEKPTEVGFSMLAGDGGFEPPHTESESAVLPLDESPID